MAQVQQARSRRSWGVAWFALCVAFSVHVIDEALNDFLSVYNPMVTAIRERWPLLPLAPLTFEFWIMRLILALATLFLLTAFVLKGRKWMLPLAYIFGVVMVANGTWHMVGSIYSGHSLPGLYSSPLLIVAGAWLLIATRTCSRSPIG